MGARGAIKCASPHPTAIEVGDNTLYLARLPPGVAFKKVMPVKALMNLVRRTLPPAERVPDGIRVYAIGDIHGRLDLLDTLLADIAMDNLARGNGIETRYIFLGDLIDRGPESRGVVDRLLAFSRSGANVRFLMGNHEQVFLRAIQGDKKALRFLGRIGGRETLNSYGITDEDYKTLCTDELAARVAALVPPAHVAFLSGFEDMIALGDYLFVHAGVRPGVGLEEQSQSDLYWIRDEFLSHRDSFGPIVVHGHSITDDVDLRTNRIGIDTGAFASGRLTALGLEGEERWFLST
jgi:serine/threonine protein phosphatase 1